MARLILHSDDLGLHPAVDEAIFDCARAGTLSSASLLANGASTESAVSTARTMPELGIGVHLNIVRGRPISPVSKVRSLVDGRRGGFFNSMATLLARSRLGLLDAAEIEGEYALQIERLLDLGVRLTHVDSEKHSHILIPQASAAVARVCARFGIGKIRKINEVGLLTKLGLRTSASWKTRGKRWLLDRNTRERAHLWSGLIGTDYTFGLAMAGCADPAAGLAVANSIFDAQGDFSVEWFFHVGRPLDYQSLAADFGTFAMRSEREAESTFLLSERMRHLVRARRSTVVSYAALGRTP